MAHCNFQLPGNLSEVQSCQKGLQTVFGFNPCHVELLVTVFQIPASNILFMKNKQVCV